MMMGILSRQLILTPGREFRPGAILEQFLLVTVEDENCKYIGWKDMIQGVLGDAHDQSVPMS